jgi:hypothetical protein
MLGQITDYSNVAAEMAVGKPAEVVLGIHLQGQADYLVVFIGVIIIVVVIVVDDHDGRAGSVVVVGASDEYGGVNRSRRRAFSNVVCVVMVVVVVIVVVRGCWRRGRVGAYGHLYVVVGGLWVHVGRGLRVGRHGTQAVAPTVQTGAFAGKARVGVFNGITARRIGGGGGCWLVGSDRLH